MSGGSNQKSNKATNPGILYGFIIVRIFLLYMSTMVSSNIMTQIYTERVLINGEEPPPLRNQILLFVVIDIIMNILLLGFILLMGDDAANYQKLYGAQYGISLLLLVILSLIISSTMYNKKYFLYKDDGLRAIRALNEMVFRIGVLISLVPFYMGAESVLTLDDKNAIAAKKAARTNAPASASTPGNAPASASTSNAAANQ